MVIVWNGNDFVGNNDATRCGPNTAALIRELSELLNHVPHHVAVVAASSDVWGTSSKFEHMFASHVAALRRACTCVFGRHSVPHEVI